MEHLKCDLNGWRQSCAADIVGLKTEFECTLIQEHCKNLQVNNYKNLCNPTAYATNLRSGSSGDMGTQTGSGDYATNLRSGSSGDMGTQTGSGDSGAVTSSTSIFALLTSVVTAFVMWL